MSHIQNSLLNRYLALEPFDRLIVEVLAVNFEALPIRSLKSTLMVRPSEKIDFSGLMAEGLVIKTRLSK